MDNRTKRLLLQCSYCAIGAVAFMASLGLFRNDYQDNWYVFFTNLSNYYCMVMMFLSLKETISSDPNERFNHKNHKFVFFGAMMITVTFDVFNLVLSHAPDRDLSLNYEAECILLHNVLPMMYVANWLMFYEKGKLSVKHVLSCLIFPLIYVSFIMIRAPFITLDPNNPDIKKYPYFFLDIETLGTVGFIKWVCIVLGVFVGVGFIYYLIDKTLAKKTQGDNNYGI